MTRGNPICCTPYTPNNPTYATYHPYLETRKRMCDLVEEKDAKKRGARVKQRMVSLRTTRINLWSEQEKIIVKDAETCRH